VTGTDAPTANLDRLAIGLSGLCLAHCIVSAVAVTAIASAGGIMLHPAIHQIGLVVAMILGAIALVRGFREHGRMLPLCIGATGIGIMAGALTLADHGGQEILFTIIGVLVVALGHDLNRRAVA
jgi:hypothetical protein